MPVELMINGRKLYGGWCQDLILLPEFRNTGIGYFLIRHALDELKDVLDMLMVAGTNANSYALFKGLNFMDMGYIKRNMRPADFRTVSEKLSANRILQPFLYACMKLFFKTRSSNLNDKIRIVQVEDFDDRFDGLCRMAQTKFKCFANKNRTLLRWRFIEQPHWKYKILGAEDNGNLKGYAILKESIIDRTRFKALRLGSIADILFDPEDNRSGKALIAASLRYFNDKVDMAQCNTISSYLQPVISSMGFVKIKSNSRFMIYPMNDSLTQDTIAY